MSVLSLALLGRYRAPVSDAEAPLLPRPSQRGSSSLPRPVAGAAAVSVLAGCSEQDVPRQSCRVPTLLDTKQTERLNRLCWRAGLASLVGGVAAGMTGLGGGQVISPLFLEMGAPPQSAAATSLLLVLFNSSSAVLQARSQLQLPLCRLAPRCMSLQHSLACRCRQALSCQGTLRRWHARSSPWVGIWTRTMPWSTFRCAF